MPASVTDPVFTVPSPRSRTAPIILIAATVLLLVEAGSLVSRGARGQSDVSVFYRTCQLLRDGVGAAIYPRADAGTGWPISMPPIGFAIYQPFSVLGPAAASAAWALFNLGMLVVIVLTIRRLITGRLKPAPTSDQPAAAMCGGASRPRRDGWPALHRHSHWVVAVLAALAAASLQVGQFSILFVTCWVLFMHAAVRRQLVWSALWLAVPAAIKVYPGILIAVPLSLIAQTASMSVVDRIAHATRFLVVFVLALLAVWLLAPMLAYGAQTWALNASWLQHVILNNAQMDYLQSLRAITNQSLDTVLLRYLSYDPAFHDQYPAIPHLGIDKHVVLQIANVARVAIVLVTAAAVLRRGAPAPPPGEPTPAVMASDPACVIAVTALWVSALYMVLPETKARYGVYLFIALLPWLARAMGRLPSTPQNATPLRPGKPAPLYGVGIALLVVLSVGLLPDVLLAWGAGFLGPLAIWAANVRWVREG